MSDVRQQSSAGPDHTLPPPRPFNPLGLIKTVFAGALMGVANIIPGVSGGTMILALGLYEEFIGSVADITAGRFTVRRIAFLGILGVCAAVTLLALSGVILSLLLYYPVAMFSLFIGLTLGGVPMLLKAMGRPKVSGVVAIVLGFAAVVAVANLERLTGPMPHNTGVDVVSGVIGSTTMVLPGVSGSYMLLILDQYERVVGAVKDLKDGLTGRDTDLLKAALWIVAPVGLGAIAGIVLLSNVLKYLLKHYHHVTVAALLGVLLGSVVGLWPFDRVPAEKALEELAEANPNALRQFALNRGVPEADSVAEVELVTHIPARWGDRATTDLTGVNATLAAALVLGGFGITSALGRMKSASQSAPQSSREA